MNGQYIVCTLGMVCALTSFGCSDGDTPGTTATTSSSSGDSGSGGTGGQGGGGTGGEAPSPETAFVSIAHLSVDAPTVEFCVSDGNGGFIGPVLGSIGVVKGLSYRQVLSHIEIPAGPSTYRLVPADATSCDVPLKDSLDSTITIAPNMVYTFMVIGQSNPPSDAKAIQVKSIEDSPARTSGKMDLRFVNVSPGAPGLDLGTGSDVTFMPLFLDVAYGSTGMVSGKSFLERDPAVDVTLSVRAHGAVTDALVAPKVSLASGGITTAYALSKSSASTSPSELLVCDASLPPKNYTFIQCSVVP
jgi:Domain of unknown function (DUF4397)